MEGPSLVILKEELRHFKGKRILAVSGNTKEAKDELKGRVLSRIDTWGKVLFLVFSKPGKKTDVLYTKTHFMMFGSYRIDEPKENRSPRLELKFPNGTLYFYACSFKFIDKDFYQQMDWKVDVMSPEFDEKYVLQQMLKKKETYLCDLFLDQTLFSGSGNIVKNEVLYNLRRHPLTKLGDVKRKDWKTLIEGVKSYCFDFYDWKKKFELRRHWQVYRRGICRLCGSKLTHKTMGKRLRSEFFCPFCQSKKHTLEELHLYPVLPISKEKVKREKRLDH